MKLTCTQKYDPEGVQGVVHSIGHVLPIHHVFPLQAFGHVAGSVANHTIGNIIPLNIGKDKKKIQKIIDLKLLKLINLSTDTVEPKSLNLQIEIVSAYSHHHHKSKIIYHENT